MNEAPRPPTASEPRSEAQEHLQACFDELRQAGTAARRQYSPAALAARHPIATVAVAGLGGLALGAIVASSRRRRKRGGEGEPSPRAGGTGALLAGVLTPVIVRLASDHLPELIGRFLHSEAKRTQADKPPSAATTEGRPSSLDSPS